MVDPDLRPVVLDNGSYTLKAGYGGESAPRILVPSLLTRASTDWGTAEWYIGEQAKRFRRQYPPSCPINHGQVTNIDELAMMWHYVYSKELRVNSGDHPLLLTEYPQLPKEHREKLIEVAFEKFAIPALCFASQASLSLYAYGLTSGLSVDIGNDTVTAAPIHETITIPNTSWRQYGGADITNYLQRLLVAANQNEAPFITTEVAQHFKEKFCYVSAMVTPDLAAAADVKAIKFQAPDGKVVSIGRERLLAPEMLFHPEMAGFQSGGLTDCVIGSIQKCSSKMQPHMFSHVVLSGGTTSFRGLSQRLEQDLRQMAPQNMPVKVYASGQRKYAVWTGGSILASLSTFGDICTTKTEYLEHGVRIVNQKCP